MPCLLLKRNRLTRLAHPPRTCSQFAWRPRPKTTLTDKDIKNLQRSISTFIERFSKEDGIRMKRLKASANKDKIESLTVFRELLARKAELAARQQAERVRLGLEAPAKAEAYEEILETVEELVSEKVEPYMG